MANKSSRRSCRSSSGRERDVTFLHETVAELQVTTDFSSIAQSNRRHDPKVSLFSFDFKRKFRKRDKRHHDDSEIKHESDCLPNELEESHNFSRVRNSNRSDDPKASLFSFDFKRKFSRAKRHHDESEKHESNSSPKELEEPRKKYARVRKTKDNDKPVIEITPQKRLTTEPVVISKKTSTETSNGLREKRSKRTKHNADERASGNISSDNKMAGSRAVCLPRVERLQPPRHYKNTARNRKRSKSMLNNQKLDTTRLQEHMEDNDNAPSHLTMDLSATLPCTTNAPVPVSTSTKIVNGFSNLSQEEEADISAVIDELKEEIPDVSDDELIVTIDANEAEYLSLRNASLTGNIVKIKSSVAENCVSYMEPHELQYRPAFPGVGGSSFDESGNTITGFLRIAPKTIKPYEMTNESRFVYWILSGEVMVRSTAFISDGDQNHLYGKTLYAGSCLLVPPYTPYTLENRSVDTEVVLGYVCTSISVP